MSFLALPLEIHQRILSYLLSHRDVAALSIQCRTLHAMCDMAMRKKYHRIRVSLGEENVGNAFELLMDILRRPRLGQYVSCIECCPPVRWHKDWEEVEYQRDLSKEDMSLVRRAVRIGGFTGPKEERVVNMLMQRSEIPRPIFGDDRLNKTRWTFISQALTAILAVVSPNLVSMTMTTAFIGHSDIEFPLFKLLEQANASPEEKPYLRNLRSIYLLNKSGSSMDDGRFYCRMIFYDALNLFDNLLSIESVRADIIEMEDIEAIEYKDQCSNISRVSILHSSVSSTYLARVIWSCKILTEFRYSIGGRDSEEGGYLHFNPKTFIKTICRNKETLEILDVDVEHQIHEFNIGDEEWRELQYNEHGGPFEEDIDEDEAAFLRSIWTHGGSLKEFVVLKRLSLGINFLLYFARGVSKTSNETKEKVNLVDCLPDNLEYLCVRGYQKGENSEHDEQMDALMAFYKSGSSQLKGLEGVEKLIPNAEPVEHPDDDSHLLWSLSELGYDSD
ncbi:hypothetical protein N7457_005380 [Penicillium paradoxum]|uniref:uncharacterized protein n=1 Tax=Penicillium paradoxum TaxID=176176 RepID=UPI0025484741|nr:uncharacterized protein N7457_005380 [Penicillium paradoxum]KAJ5780220.1 hypothetical protein N7457_005380 [Penicillium paradoxum]